MKIIHCGDIHLDSKMTSNLSKEQARERKMEILRTFTRMVDYAKKNGVRAIMIAGDLFDTHNISATARNLVKDTILQNPEIDFFYLRGNHDDDNFLSRLDETPANLKLFGNKWTTYSYGNIAITGLELNAANQVTAYNSLVLDHDVFNIVLMHGQLNDYASKKNAEIISLDDLKNKSIDYLALGHYHEYRDGMLDARGAYCYCGCLEGRGFDECGEKGFVLVDIDEYTRHATYEFIPFGYRTLYTIPVDVSGVMTTQEASQKIENVISELGYSSRSMVKIVLCGEVDVDCEINCQFLQDMFQNYFYYEKVYDETSLLIKYSDYEKDVSLKGEFIRMVLNSDLDEAKKSEVIRCGIQALIGEEI